MAIVELWRNLEAWLDQHRPEVFNDLTQPASKRDILQIADRLSQPLPDDLVASWMRHDGETFGADFVFGGMRRLLSVSDAIEQIEEYTADAKRCGTLDNPAEIRTVGPVMPFDWSSAWCPFLLDNTVIHCVDLVPAAGGTVGQIIVVDHEALTLTRIATDFREFFSRGAESVMAGDPWPFYPQRRVR